jgi:hypothetical protein
MTIDADAAAGADYNEVMMVVEKSVVSSSNAIPIVKQHRYKYTDTCTYTYTDRYAGIEHTIAQLIVLVKRLKHKCSVAYFNL